MKTSAQLRQGFLEYFAKQGHSIVPSSSLVPGNDPTLLFTNAGMVQFKEVFLGRDKRPYTRATSAQRCVRAGGKHNDLENVGHTARHHTFFEMLGNFSFGDYFKGEAIRYSWEFLTKVVSLPAERLWVSVYADDDEAADIWLNEVKVDPRRFSRCGDADNFWSMGDTGPCGPCTEIFYDHGPEIAGGPPGSADQDGDRYIEIWNLVFMQYDRAADGSLTPLPKPSVDTGMGLERLAAVVQGVHNNYDIDLFQHLIAFMAKLAGVNDLSDNSLRVIADHIRSCAFLIVDGVMPSNEGRGYVLRRIIRRALRHGNKLGLHDPFFCKMVKPLIEVMGQAYPELVKMQATVERVLKQEEEQFDKTLDQGLKILEQAIAGLNKDVIPGATVFRLYDTFGFPVDLTADIARERGLALDYAGFEAEMAKQRSQSQQASKFGGDYHDNLELEATTDFTGYHELEHEAKVVALFHEGQPVEKLNEHEAGMIVLDKTPFYAESGGQVGDKGNLQFKAGRFAVEDTQKYAQAHLHYGELAEGSIRVGEHVLAKVDLERRRATMLNHSATHLLNAALRRVLGEHIEQRGSLVDDERLRFDFSHLDALTQDELQAIEYLVNAKIRANYDVRTELKTQDEAVAGGAIALFGEKYGEQVRVLTMGEFSKELCGGTHVKRTGDIGFFKIINETGIAAGVRRIEAVTGEVALHWVEQNERVLREMAGSLKTDRSGCYTKVEQLLQRNRGLEKELEQLKAKLASAHGDDLANEAVNVAGIKVLAAQLQVSDAKALRDTVDQLKNKLGSAAIVLASVDGDKIRLVAGVTKDSLDKVKAGELVNHVATQVGGKGGGRADMAQAGGNQPAALSAALDSVVEWVKQQLG